MKKWKIHFANTGSFTVSGKTFWEALNKSIIPYGAGQMLSITELTKKQKPVINRLLKHSTH